MHFRYTNININQARPLVCKRTFWNVLSLLLAQTLYPTLLSDSNLSSDSARMRFLWLINLNFPKYLNISHRNGYAFWPRLAVHADGEFIHRNF